MNNAAPENNAALQDRIKDLEQQLKLSDEGNAHLAERCLALEQEVQSYLAAHPQREMHTDSPTLLQPLLYYDAGFGFSEKDTLTAPDCVTDELTGSVTATFELPVAAQALRFDPGELPCCVTKLIFSDDRIVWHPANGLNLHGDTTLFLGDDPNYRLEGLNQYPAGMKLVVSYCYFPLEALTDEPLFCAVLESVQLLQKNKDSEKRHITELEQTAASQQQTIADLQQTVNQLYQKNAELQAQSKAYETSLENVLSSSSWKFTAPIRRLLGLFHRGN